MYCTYCGSDRHQVRFCPKTHQGSANRLHLRCTYCGGRDHEIQACPKTYQGSAVLFVEPEAVREHFIKDPEIR